MPQCFGQEVVEHRGMRLSPMRSLRWGPSCIMPKERRLYLCGDNKEGFESGSDEEDETSAS